MNVGRVRVASWWGISPIEPLTSSANTIPTAFGCSALSRDWRNPTPCGFIAGSQLRPENTASVGSVARAWVMAWWASRL